MMPNNYAMVITGYANPEKFNVDEFNKKYDKGCLCAAVHPMPAEISAGTGDDQCDWAKEEWGTKWGTYDILARHVMGDHYPVVITCQCAWRPPKPRILRQIVALLTLEIGLESPVVVGLNPYDSSSKILWSEAVTE